MNNYEINPIQTYFRKGEAGGGVQNPFKVKIYLKSKVSYKIKK